MLERELKFHVPARQRAGLKARLQKLGADVIELQARYYDTDELALASAGIALRLRLEGDAWVQTMKTPGPDEVSRIEWNHPRPDATLDLTAYDDTHVAPLMAKLAERLRPRYGTQITRLKKVVPTDSGSVEVAYDEGNIVSGDLALPVHELEIEGIAGDAADIFTLAESWLSQHQLVLELRSKAARGDALARLAKDAMDVRTGDAAVASAGVPRLRTRRLSTRQMLRLAAPIRAGQPCLPPDIDIRSAYLHCANDCLSQILRNSALLAGVDGIRPGHDHRIEYVHQIRVGIRRLRTCWKLFGKTANPPPALTEALKEHFRVLGQARDQDVIETELLPRLMQAGMPPDTSEPVADISEAPAARARLTATPAYQQTLLDLLKHLVLYGDSHAANDPRKLAAPILTKRLDIWLARIRRDSEGFLDAHWDDRHALRKRVKRLRYGMEFTQGLMDPTRLEGLRSALVSAQKSLGQLNDLYVAAEYYRGNGARHPSAMFALGWLAATQQHEAQASNVALQALSRAGEFSAATSKPRKKKQTPKAKRG